MGNCINNNLKGNPGTNKEEINITQFNYIKQIGKGGFGKVWKIEHKIDKKIYAMKEMSKPRIVFKNCIQSIINEQKILTQLHNMSFYQIYYRNEICLSR